MCIYHVDNTQVIHVDNLEIYSTTLINKIMRQNLSILLHSILSLFFINALRVIFIVRSYLSNRFKFIFKCYANCFINYGASEHELKSMLGSKSLPTKYWFFSAKFYNVVLVAENYECPYKIKINVWINWSIAQYMTKTIKKNSHKQ